MKSAASSREQAAHQGYLVVVELEVGEVGAARELGRDRAGHLVHAELKLLQRRQVPERRRDVAGEAVDG